MSFTIFNKTETDLKAEIRGAGLPVSFDLPAFSFEAFDMHDLVIDIIFLFGEKPAFFCSDYKISSLNVLIIHNVGDQLFVTEYAGYEPKPVFFLAHQCNLPSEVIEATENGANGIEA